MHYLLFLDVDGVLNSMSFYHSVESITENPVDPEAEHLALKQAADKIMIVSRVPVETLLTTVRFYVRLLQEL